MNLINSYKKLDKTILTNLKYIKLTNANFLHNSKRVSYRNEYIYRVYEIVFIKIYTAWEEYLENSFIDYITGCTTNKCKPVKIFNKIDRMHAYKILKGTKEYPNWTSLSDVRTLAKLFFKKGNPYELSLSQIETQFNEMKKVRDAIVHMSKKSKDSFIGVLKSKIKAYNIKMSPGEYLYNYWDLKKKETFLDYYVSSLRIAAQKIVGI